MKDFEQLTVKYSIYKYQNILGRRTVLVFGQFAARTLGLVMALGFHKQFIGRETILNP
jgi:tetrahydromethanopterin S-methyltransferase subunit F